jgi:hypothetical protein
MDRRNSTSNPFEDVKSWAYQPTYLRASWSLGRERAISVRLVHENRANAKVWQDEQFSQFLDGKRFDWRFW